jgi:hypothetical protein
MTICCPKLGGQVVICLVPGRVDARSRDIPNPAHTVREKQPVGERERCAEGMADDYPAVDIPATPQRVDIVQRLFHGPGWPSR